MTTLELINQEIKESEAQLSESETRFWKLIRIKPEQWKQHPEGDEGGGFWVVALFDNQVIYYNDIEEGFNTSSYRDLGTIDEYWCNQDELRTVIHNLLSS
jgi:hypothetical protein